MLKKKQSEKQLIYNFDMEDYIPKDHFLRLVKENIRFEFIYEKVKHLYPNTGQPAVDPVVLIKMLLIGYFYDIKSERQLEKEIQVNLAYRWFINYNLDEKIPDHSTLSQTRKRKFKESRIFQDIFDEIVKQCIKKGYLTGETILTDSTLIRANASLDSMVKNPKPIDDFFKDLDREVDENRKSNQTHISKTDPDSKLAFKKNKRNAPGLFYHEHKSMDLNGYITDVYITPGHIKEHIPYIQRIERQMFAFKFNTKNVVADRAYGMPEIYKKMYDLKINAFIGTRYNGRNKDGYFNRSDYFYNKKKDQYVCPAGIILEKKFDYEKEKTHYYYAKSNDCRSCRSQKKCIQKSSKRFNPKMIGRHFYQNIIDEALLKMNNNEWKYYMRKRKTIIEGSFGDAKQNYSFWKTKFRGIKKVQEQSLMTAIAQNIKKMMKDLKSKTSLNLKKSIFMIKSRFLNFKKHFAYEFI